MWALLLLAVAECVGCRRSGGPQSAYENARQTFIHGDLVSSQSEAEQGYQRFRNLNPAWARKFRVLQAESLLWRGMSQETLAVLDSEPAPSPDRSLTIETLAIEGVAHARLRSFSEAESSLSQAEERCAQLSDPMCGNVTRAEGVLAIERGHLAQARQFFSSSLSFARARADHFLEASDLMNLSASALKEGHFDEAVDWAEAAYRSATAIDARSLELKALSNLGWAYYNLGDLEQSLGLFQETEKRAAQLGDVFDQENELTNTGYVQMDQRKFDLAAQSFQEALQLAESNKVKQHVYNALRVLARLSLQTGDLDDASKYAGRALSIAHESGNHPDELYPMLVEGQTAARRRKSPEGEKTFQSVERDPSCPIPLRWEAQHSLARLYEDEKKPDSADREYRAALATFESARDTVRHEDFQLSFLTNAARIYDDYIHFLVSQGKPDEALRWADYSRARTLSEGLGLLSKGALKGEHAGPPPLRAQEISRRAKGTLLFYWLGEKQSYLWAITQHKTSLFPLPPGAEIDALVQRYRRALNGPQDVLTSSEEARSLYRTLIVPAQSLLAHDGKVFIVPDGSLNNLNFETLIVPEPLPHFWIEDADVTNASSLHVLGASVFRPAAREKMGARELLLVGDSIAPSKDYPELPRAAEQMASVARHFPKAQQHVYQHEQATPAAYFDGNPEQFSYIHFVAHGIASRLSPLDSAIVLSSGGGDTESFKLYARDIIGHPLRADLVTISACYGAGERAYSGEGLVGLAWAFLRAGAHNVIAGLWEVTDASTEQLMDRFYDELDKGASPDTALRAAKLSLLRSSNFHNPFYWAPFQLYTGS
jgi:CHAT domain-containing protein